MVFRVASRIGSWISIPSASRPGPEKGNLIDKLLDIDLWLERKPERLIKTLKESIIDTFDSCRGDNAERLRKRPIEEKAIVCAALWSASGTSKTEIAKAVAVRVAMAL